MKNTGLLFILFLFVLNSTNYAQDWWNNDAYLAEDISMQPDTTPGSNWIYPTLFNWNYEIIANPGVNSGSVGAMYFQNKFYFNRFNSNIIYRYDGGLDGPGSFIDSITYVGSIKDLTTDGEYLYGGTATSTVYKFDADGTTIGTITLGSPAVARAIAYTPDENGFFVCNSYDNIVLCDAETGAVIRVLTGTNMLANKYGLAYSNLTGDGPILWVWGQGTTTDPYNNLWKVNPTTGDTIAKYRFGPLPCQPVLKGIAGGAEVCTINKSSVLLLNYQNYALIGYRLGEALPVELNSFTGKVVQNNIILDWSTATETNNHGFEIQRSLSSGGFQTIAFINGHGTSTEKHYYSFTDKNPEAGKNIYRLKQLDYNGQFEYSKGIVIEAGGPARFDLFQNYPNPFNPSTTITFALAADSRVTMKIYNIIGQELLILFKGELSAGKHSVKFNASGYPSGIYFCRLEASGINGSYHSSVREMVLNK
jgi:hypothetical protein